MLAESIALVAAFLWASGSIFTKKGLEVADPVSGGFINLLVQVIVTGIPAIFVVPIELFFSEAVLFFVFSGFLGAFLNVRLQFLAIAKAGVAIAVPIVAASPLFSALVATVLLDERITGTIGVGTILIVVGVGLLSLRSTERREGATMGVFIALLAAFVNGSALIPAKIGISQVNHPLFAILVEGIVGGACFSVYLAFLRRRPTFNRRSLSLFSGVGLCSTAAVFFSFAALNLGQVIVVSPLINTTPVFALFLTRLFLRKRETVSPKIAVATLLIIFGSTVIVAF